jgi:hypothetical protein
MKHLKTIRSMPHSKIVVESTISTRGVSHEIQSLSPAQRYFQQRARSTRKAWCAVFLTAMLTGLVLSYIYLWQDATIVITPATTVRTARITITASRHPKDETQSQARQFRAAATSPFIAVRATGTAYTPAVAAKGVLTWYNQQSFPERIPAGTVVSATLAVQVETLSDSVVPASSLTSPGTTDVSAQAVQAGTRGNIGALTINKFCICGTTSGVLVKNLTPFTGGKDREAHQVVQASDLERAVAPLSHDTMHKARAALYRQEAGFIVGPPSCSSSVMLDHPLGDRKPPIRAALTLTCTAAAANMEDIRKKAFALFLDRVRSQLSSHDRLRQISVPAIQVETHDGSDEDLLLAVNVTGEFTYQLGQMECRKLQSLLAGKAQWQAQPLLAHFPGVRQASLQQLVPWLALPGDPQRITILPKAICAQL